MYDAIAIGQPFTPWSKTCGFYPADIVARIKEFDYVEPRRDRPGRTPRDRTPVRRQFSDGMKRLYERCVRWAGQKDRMWWSYDRMAQELGKSSRQIKRDMVGLEGAGLMRHKQRGFTQSNLYEFLWIEAFTSEVTSRAEIPPLAVDEVTCVSLHEVPPVSLELSNRELCKEDSVRAGFVEGAPAPPAPIERRLEAELVQRQIYADGPLLRQVATTLHHTPVGHFLDVLDQRLARGRIGTGLLIDRARLARRSWDNLQAIRREQQDQAARAAQFNQEQAIRMYEQMLAAKNTSESDKADAREMLALYRKVVA